MGEDLFWAIRGGGGTSFGIVTSWKVKLVPVPPVVAVFSVSRTASQGAVELIDKWQRSASKFHEDLFIRVVIQPRDGKEAEAVFNSLFLGRCSELLPVMAQSFPELGLRREDCRQMTWIKSVLYFAYFTDEKPLEELLDRGSNPVRFFKAKSDHVSKPIPSHHLERIWGSFAGEGPGVMIMDPYGGRMSNFSAWATPFPYREGVLYFFVDFDRSNIHFYSFLSSPKQEP